MASRRASRTVIFFSGVPSGISGSAKVEAAEIGAPPRRRRDRSLFRLARLGFVGGGLGHGRGRSRGGFGGAVLALQLGDRGVDLDVLRAGRHQDRLDHALVDGFDFHRRLVGLDLGDHVAGLDGVAFLDQPLGQGPLFHRRGQGGHQDVRHWAASRYTSV
jgi:hypothetical protein